MGPGSTRLSTGEACAPAQPSERIGVPGHLRIGLTARGPVAAGFHRPFKRATNKAGRGRLFEASDVRVATRYLYPVAKTNGMWRSARASATGKHNLPLKLMSTRAGYVASTAVEDRLRKLQFWTVNRAPTRSARSGVVSAVGLQARCGLRSTEPNVCAVICGGA